MSDTVKSSIHYSSIHYNGFFLLKPQGTDPYARAARMALTAFGISLYSHDPELAKTALDWSREEAEKAGEGGIPDVKD